MRVVVQVLARRPSLLLKLLEQFAFRKALGAEPRLLALRLLGAEIGKDVFIGARVWIRTPENLSVGDRTKLRGSIVVDSHLPVRFGHDVLVEEHTALLSCEHDVNSPTFQWTGGPLTIGDHAWLPRQVTVLPGAHIGEGAVVGAGSIVTRPVAPYTIVAGNPARKIGDRQRYPYRYP
jgi:acetyltransferase-like isoleucine patch superfamily enzyme